MPHNRTQPIRHSARLANKPTEQPVPDSKRQSSKHAQMSESSDARNVMFNFQQPLVVYGLENTPIIMQAKKYSPGKSNPTFNPLYKYSNARHTYEQSKVETVPVSEADISSGDIQFLLNSIGGTSMVCH